MKDHVRDESLKTPLNKGLLLKNVKDERLLTIYYVLRANTSRAKYFYKTTLVRFSLGVWAMESGSFPSPVSHFPARKLRL